MRAEASALKAKRDALEKDIPSTMVSKELEKPRPAYVLIRGQYDKKGEAVGPDVPAILPRMAPSETTNRLNWPNGWWTRDIR